MVKSVQQNNPKLPWKDSVRGENMEKYFVYVYEIWDWDFCASNTGISIIAEDIYSFFTPYHVWILC